MFRRITVSQFLVWLLMSACAGAQTSNSTTAPMDEEQTSKNEKLEVVSIPEVAGDPNVTTKPPGAISPGPEMRRLVDLAKNDLATKLSINGQEIETLQADFVTWRDSSAGCPQPGTQYLQVLTNGTRILIKANNATYQYHSGGDRSTFLCKNPSSIGPLPYQDGEA